MIINSNKSVYAKSTPKQPRNLVNNNQQKEQNLNSNKNVGFKGFWPTKDQLKNCFKENLPFLICWPIISLTWMYLADKMAERRIRLIKDTLKK